MLQGIDHGGLDYFPAEYGTGRCLFRGPQRPITEQSIVAVGGTQTFGKFIAEPWPERLERSLGRPVVNVGSVNGGVDMYLNAAGLAQRIGVAQAVVVELFGTAHLTNRFYSVHPLRNDRVLKAHPALRRLYPEVDFAEFAFIRHLLSHLQQLDPNRFQEVVRTLQATWLDRMQQLIAVVGLPIIGLWLADDLPPREGHRIGTDPLFVTESLLQKLRPHLSGLVAVTPGAEARSADKPGRIFGPLDQIAAETVFPAAIHQQTAHALIEPLERCLQKSNRHAAMG